MALYAIGDVQGCYAALEALLERIRFDRARDRLWFVGDLVNRGPDSLRVLRLVRSLGETAVAVLGNHDLHLLAVAVGCVPARRKDTFHDVLGAPDRDDLLAWLRARPLLHREGGYVLVHAGLLPQWTPVQAAHLARGVEAVLRAPEYRTFLQTLPLHDLTRWSEDLTGMARLRVVTHALTRLRACTAEGEMDFSYTGPPDAMPDGYLPWFRVQGRRSAAATIVCGHWAALGLHLTDELLALDSGCVYGRHLTALRLDDRQVFQVSCSGCV